MKIHFQSIQLLEEVLKCIIKLLSYIGIPKIIKEAIQLHEGVLQFLRKYLISWINTEIKVVYLIKWKNNEIVEVFN